MFIAWGILLIGYREMLLSRTFTIKVKKYNSLALILLGLWIINYDSLIAICINHQFYFIKTSRILYDKFTILNCGAKSLLLNFLGLLTQLNYFWWDYLRKSKFIFMSGDEKCLSGPKMLYTWMRIYLNRLSSDCCALLRKNKF